MRPRIRITVELLNAADYDGRDIELYALSLDQLRVIWNTGGQWLNRMTPLHSVIVEGERLKFLIGDHSNAAKGP